MSILAPHQFNFGTRVLNCWVRGTDVDSMFTVRLSKTATVTALKVAIHDMNKIQVDFPAHALNLYTPRVPLAPPFQDNLSQIILSEHAEHLTTAPDELSVVFPEQPPKRHIHIIVDAPSMMIICWLRGNPFDAHFEIVIRADATLSELKRQIRETHPILRNVVDEHIGLYRLSGNEGEIEESLKRMADGHPLRISTLLPNFLGVPVLDPFLVVAEDTHNDTAPTQVGERDDILTVLTESFKRTTAITSKSLTPSQAAKSSEYAKTQSGGQRLLDCRCAAENPANTVAPPIQLFNPAFAYFSSKAFDPEYHVPDDLVLNVRDLMAQFALIHPSEVARQHRLKPVLQKIIGRPLTVIINSDKTSPDVVALSSCRELSVYLIVGEENNEFGDGGSDPSIQAAFSFLRILSLKEVMTSILFS